MPFLEPGTHALHFELWGWDVPELRFLWKFLSPGMVFLDIGAYHGLYSVLAAKKLGAQGRIVAFEPNPADCARIERHVSLNRCVGVELLQVALFSAEGSARFMYPLREPRQSAACDFRSSGGASLAPSRSARMFSTGCAGARTSSELTLSNSMSKARSRTCLPAQRVCFTRCVPYGFSRPSTLPLVPGRLVRWS